MYRLTSQKSSVSEFGVNYTNYNNVAVGEAEQ